MNRPFQGIYRARCTRVVDGDTCDVVLDLGFHLTATFRLRLWGVNTPEMHAKDPAERVLAANAANFLANRLMMIHEDEEDEWPLRVETLRDTDSFGRWLAKVAYTDPDGNDVLVNDELVMNGHAVPFRR